MHRASHFGCCAGAARGAFPLSGTQRKYERPLPFLVTHLGLELEVDLAQKCVRGTATLDLVRRTLDETQVRLDAVDFEVARVEVDLGKGFEAHEFEYDDRTLSLNVGKQVRTATVRVHYTAHPRRGLYFLGPDTTVTDRPVQVWSQCQDEDARHWFPCDDKPHVKQTVDFRITAPKGFDVLCNGTPGPSGPKRKSRTGTPEVHCFRITQPIPSYLVTLVVGHFSLLEDRPARLASGREVPVRYLVPKGREADGKRAFGQTPTMIELFSALTGVEYPYDRYTQVVVSDFIFGGMENTTATTMYEHILLDERAAIDIESHDLVAHELAHQWFGDWVTCKDWSHAWLNEGFATFFEHLERESRLGRTEYLWGIERDLRSYLTETRARYSRPIVCRDYEEPIDLFDRHLYEQGGLVLHMLRGKLGDKVFWQGVGDYLRAYGGKHVVTDELRACLETASGQTLERFFDEWVYRPGHPKLNVKLRWDKKAVTVDIRQEQAHPFDLEVVLEIGIGKAGATKRVVVRADQSHVALTIPLKSRPVYVAVDPECAIAGELNVDVDTNWARAQLAQGTSPRTRRQAAGWLRGKLDQKTLDALSSAVLDSDAHWTVRTTATDTLAATRSEAAFATLQRALKDKEPHVRAAAAEGLGNFRSSASAQTLIRAMKRERSYLVRAAAARALGKTEAASAAATLQQGLELPSWGSVVACASLEGLGTLDGELHAKTLIEYTAYGKPTPVRRAAIAQLPDALPARKASKVLEKLLGDEAPHVRTSAVIALEKVGTGHARALLKAHLGLESDGRTKRRLNEALRKLNRPQDNRELRQKLDRLERELGELKAEVARNALKVQGPD